jgi:hypothetical protein
VAEQPGERQQVAAEQQVAGREGVPERVGRVAHTADSGSCPEPADSTEDGGRAQRPAVVIEKDRTPRGSGPAIEVSAERARVVLLDR